MKILILGAGPSGLTVAAELLEHGYRNLLILEKENEAGGLCRSKLIDHAPIDIGGGHFLDTNNDVANEFLMRYLPRNEWIEYERDSRILIGKKEISHPLEANIWQFDVEDQIRYLKSVSQAGCNTGKKQPERFVDWICWKLGEAIANEYMIPYNRKMFSNELNNLGTYWLEKLPNVSFEETIRSCLMKKAYGKQPGHSRFLYPKRYGYGEVWKRIADSLNGHIEYNRDIEKIDFEKKRVYTSDNECYKADIIITTIPWKEYINIIGMPHELKNEISMLKNNSIQVSYFSKNIETNAHWIYIPADTVPYHRILVRSNFYNGAVGYWTETNLDRVKIDYDEGEISYVNRYAYPLNTMDKPRIMNRLLLWSREHGVIGLGRWGEHQHYNSDVTVKKAIELAHSIYN